MKLNRRLVMIAALVLSVAIATGGTLAYLSDQEVATNVMTLGNVDVVQFERERVTDSRREYNSDYIANQVTFNYQNFTQEQALYPAVIKDTETDTIWWYRGDDFFSNNPNKPESSDNPEVEMSNAIATPKEGDTLADAYFEVVRPGSINNYIDKIVSVTNAGNSAAYVRTVIAIPSGGWKFADFIGENTWLHFNYVADSNLIPDTDAAKNIFTSTKTAYDEYRTLWHWDKNQNADDDGKPDSANDWDVVTGIDGTGVDINGTKYFIFTVTHAKELPEPARSGVAGESTYSYGPTQTGFRTAPNLLGFYMDPHVDNDFDAAGNVTYWYKNGNTQKEIKNFTTANGKVEILVATQAVQTEGFDNPWEALDAGFGKISEGNHPWTNTVTPVVPVEKDGKYTIDNAAELFGFAYDVNVNGNSYTGKTVELAADINLNYQEWTPIGQTGATQFKGTFDGKNHTISNLVIDSSDKTGEYYASGLFGWTFNSTIQNVKVDGARVNGHAYVGVIAGYLEWEGCSVTNCHVVNAIVTNTHAGVACGDKTGVIVGYAGNVGTSITKCTAKDSEVYGARDAGQIVGAALTANVIRCTATNVTVGEISNNTCDDDGKGTNIREAVIGREL